jgi:hypothetical protein
VEEEILMICRVEFKKSAMNQLFKIDDNALLKSIFLQIRDLKYKPRAGKCLFEKVYELKFEDCFVYYSLYKGIIYVESVNYVN